MVFRPLYLVICFFVAVLAQKEPLCLEYLAEDITDGKLLPGGAILKTNITYDKQNYYIKDGKKWGCTCNVNSCIQMCCGVGKVLFNRTCNVQDNHSEVNISIYDGTYQLLGYPISQFSFIHSILCPESHERIFTEETDFVYMQKNGSLFFRSIDYQHLYSPGHYCLTNDETGMLRTILCEYVNAEENVVRDIYVKGNNVYFTIK